MKLYGLSRGGQWVCLPSTAYRLRKATRQAKSAGLVHRETGEPTYLAGLTLGGVEHAWTTSSLDVALARQDLLVNLPGGWATTVTRVA
jgi:hypothetical protein